MPRVTHFEIYDNSQAVQPFYRDIFGWKFQKFEGGPIEYWLITTGRDDQPRINGGMARPREGQNPGTINALAVASLDHMIGKSKSAVEKFMFQRRRSRKSVGSPTPKIRLATSLESSSRIQTQSD